MHDAGASEVDGPIVGGKRRDPPEDQDLFHSHEAGLVDELFDFSVRRFLPAVFHLGRESYLGESAVGSCRKEESGAALEFALRDDRAYVHNMSGSQEEGNFVRMIGTITSVTEWNAAANAAADTQQRLAAPAGAVQQSSRCHPADER